MKKNKKKLIIFMPSMEGGGVEKNLVIIANYIKKKGIDVNLISFDNKFKKNFDKKINFITPQFKASNKSKYYKYFFCLLLLARELIKNDCLVFSFQANIYSIILCKIFKTQVIVRSNSSPSGWNKNFLKNFIFRFFLKRSDEIIVNSLNFKKELDKKFCTKSIVIFNPLNKQEIIKKSKKKIKFNFFSKKSLNIINVARFTDQKDHLTLLKAFKIVNKKIENKLLIIGYGSNEKLMRNFIKENDLKNDVKIFDFKKNPFPYIKKSNIFVLTSKYEGLPNVLIEATVLKKLVISTDCPTGPKEILNNGKFGELFNIGDYQNLSKKILSYKKKRNKFKKKVLLGYKNLNMYDYAKNCDRYFKIVKKYIDI